MGGDVDQALFAEDDAGQRSSCRSFYFWRTGKTCYQRWLKFLGLFREQCDVTAGRQCHYMKMLWKVPYYVQRLPADRPGAAEQSYAPWEISHMFLFNFDRCIFQQATARVAL